jgi:hypothetical protein
LLFVLLRLAELGGGFGELQLEQILAMPDARQVGAELIRLAMPPGPLAKAIDRAPKGFDVGIRRRDRLLD